MFSALRHIFKLISHFWVLGRAGAGLPSVLRAALPLPLRLLLPKKHRASKKNPAPLAHAFAKLGPTYIKLGQFLAVRRDILDDVYIKDLSHLHDKLPPFPQAQALKILADNFPDNPFTSFSEPLAAASIAQVHKATTADGKSYAVKLLRPGIKKRFHADIKNLFWAAEKLERHLPAARRLRPRAALKNLEDTTLREMDLRLEAAAMSEIRENSKNMEGIYIPTPAWLWTKQSILTMEWVDGIPLSDLPALKAAGFDLPKLAATILRSFMTHALYDGIFHADYHPGNLFARADGTLVPIDFGIVGTLPLRDRRAMAWILRGLLQGDYDLAAREHIWAGYVPRHTPRKLFASALRAIGEPILDKAAQDISMADLLWQLFETAGKFEMETQPQLLLLQKTMVASEGLARTLDPELNIWEIAAPLVENWIKREYAPDRILHPDNLRQGIRQAQQLLQALPALLTPQPQPPAAAPELRKTPLRALLIAGIIGGALGVLLTKIYTNPSFFM